MVIGSDKQKKMVISQGCVPRLMILLSQENASLPIRYDAAIVLGTINVHLSKTVSVVSAMYLQVRYRKDPTITCGLSSMPALFNC